MTILASISTIYLSSALTAGGADFVCSGSLAVNEDEKSGEVYFVSDWPADVHWFGAYLRKGDDRYSIHPEPFVPGGYFVPGEPDKDGRSNFTFVVKPGFVDDSMSQIRFRARHAKNPTPPDAAAVAALGKKAHPRLILKPGDDVFARIKQATATNELLAAAVRHMREYADLTLSTKPNPYKLDGRRLWSQPCTARTFALAQMWKMTGDRRYLDRLEAELRAIAAYPDWNPPHFIDTALFAFDFAIAYDWLYDDWSPEMRNVLAKALIEKALRAAEPDAFWVHNGNNWSQACLCGMLAAAVAIAEREPELAREHIDNAVSFFHEPMEAYAPCGAFPEGVGYWIFATTYQIFAIESLRSAFGTDFGLMDEPGFRATAMFPDMMTGPSGLLFNHSDSGKVRSKSAPLWWFARELGRPDVTTVERKIALASYAAVPGETAGHRCDNCFFPLIWMVDVPKARKNSLPLSWWSGSTVPVAVHTSTRDDPDAIWVAMKGGTAQASHAHADQSSFVLDALGVRWAEDLGGESYGIGEDEHGMKFWDSDNASPRWKYFRLGLEGHNVVTIEGENPNVGGFATISFRRTDPARAGKEIACDLTSIHPAAKSAKRIGSLVAAGKRYAIHDAFSGLKPGTALVWRMNTYAKPTIDGKVVLLERDGRKLRLEASQGEWSIFVPPLPTTNPDPNVVQLQLRVVAESDDVAWSVTFTPVGKDSSK